MSIAETWGTSPGERNRPYPCDAILARNDLTLFRGITIGAPASRVFRWLCQLRVAPYSYDWIDNGGRRSPQGLTPGLDELAVGQQVMTIFELVSFERDSHFTLRMRARRARSLFGQVAITYHVAPMDTQTTRLVAKVCVDRPAGPYGWFVRNVLPWGDLVMMRKQFHNLKRLAERDGLSF